MAQLRVADSDRMRYSLIGAADADFLFALDQNPNVMRFINGGSATSRDDIAQVFLPRLARYRDPERGWGLWKAAHLESGDPLGWILVRPMDFFSDAPQWDNWELGWRFFESQWGKGLATEAALAVMSALEQRGGFTRLSAIADCDNHGSINIMRKLGMSYVKTYQHQDSMLGAMEVVLYERAYG